MTLRLSAVLSVIIGTLASTASAQSFDVLATFDPALGELPESIASDQHGQLYFSMGSTVRKRARDGTLSVYGTLPIPAFVLGVKVGPDGCVYNVSTSLNPAVVGAFVWRICSQGHVEQVAALDPTGGPNDLAFDRDGQLYVTDPFLGRIWQIDPQGHARVWLEDPLLLGDPDHPALLFHAQGVNGIAFDRGEHNLYVGNLDRGRILRIPVRCGEPGRIRVVAEDPALIGADGIAFDEREELYVTVGAQDALVRVDRWGRVSPIAQGGVLEGPSSVAFGRTRADKHSLYIADLSFLRGFGLIPGPAHPALLRLRVAVPGLPLP